MSETVAVIGAGSVGSTLLRAWAQAGHPVVIGTRDPSGDAVTALADETGASAQPVADTIASAEVVVLTVPGAAAKEVVRANADALATKIVIDASNDLSDGPTGSALSSLAVLAEVAPSAAGYRAFNTIGWEVMADPLVGGVRADLPFAGPDGATRTQVERLIAEVGFGPIYVGSDAAAHHAVDALMVLWFALALGQGHGRHTALKILTD